ncbi:MAG: hypothetical protein NTAFB01_03420 [Nitrospira sp.]
MIKISLAPNPNMIQGSYGKAVNIPAVQGSQDTQVFYPCFTCPGCVAWGAGDGGGSDWALT